MRKAVLQACREIASAKSLAEKKVVTTAKAKEKAALKAAEVTAKAAAKAKASASTPADPKKRGLGAVIFDTVEIRKPFMGRNNTFATDDTFKKSAAAEIAGKLEPYLLGVLGEKTRTSSQEKRRRTGFTVLVY